MYNPCRLLKIDAFEPAQEHAVHLTRINLVANYFPCNSYDHDVDRDYKRENKG